MDTVKTDDMYKMDDDNPRNERRDIPLFGQDVLHGTPVFRGQGMQNAGEGAITEDSEHAVGNTQIGGPAAGTPVYD